MRRQGADSPWRVSCLPRRPHMDDEPDAVIPAEWTKLRTRGLLVGCISTCGVGEAIWLASTHKETMDRTALGMDIAPSQAAIDLGAVMMERADVNQSILEETLVSAMDGQILESGRTVCGNGSDLRDAVLRMPAAVELAACPMGMEGVWHTHVTRPQFKDPEHSLPDMANVIFEGINVSIVTGMDTSQVFYAPENPDAARAAFQSVLGLDIRSTSDVKDAITAGQVPNPTEARARLFKELSPLVERVKTPLLDRSVLSANLGAIPRTMSGPNGASVAYELYECALKEIYADIPTVSAQTYDNLKNNLRSSYGGARTLLERAVTEGFDEAIGIIVGTLVVNYLLGRQRR